MSDDITSRYRLSDSERAEIIAIADRNSVPRQLVAELFDRVYCCGGWETDSLDVLEGLEDIVKLAVECGKRAAA